VSARDLARWAADAFAGYDLAATHRIVTAATGPGPLPDHVSARADPFTGLVGLPRPVGVVLARVSAGGDAAVDEVVRRVLLTRNALLVEVVPAEVVPVEVVPVEAEAGAGSAVAERVRHLASLAEAAGAPAGVLQVLDRQLLDAPAEVDAVLAPVADAPVVVIVDEGEQITVDDPGAVVLAVGAGCADLGAAVRAARGILRETGGDRIRVYSADPLRVAAALPVTRVAVGDLEMPPPPPGGLLTWTWIGTGRPIARQPWVAPRAPVPAYPHASNESP
jgi:hypothetical protein